MIRQIFKNRFWAVAVICLSLALSSSEAFAWGGGGHRDARYHYREGRWHRPGWFGLDVVVTALAVGAIVEALPPRNTTVVVAGTPYYYYDNVYFRPCPAGYVVVPTPAPAPAVVAVPVAQLPATALSTVVINVPNSDGTYTPVTLIKEGNGYIGPQGERYQGNPTVEQLKTLYGK